MNLKTLLDYQRTADKDRMVEMRFIAKQNEDDIKIFVPYFLWSALDTFIWASIKYANNPDD